MTGTAILFMILSFGVTGIGLATSIYIYFKRT